MSFEYQAFDLKLRTSKESFRLRIELLGRLWSRNSCIPLRQKVKVLSYNKEGRKLVVELEIFVLNPQESDF